MQTVMARDFSIETAIENRPTQMFIFYAGNLIAPLLRATVPEWRHGGLLRMDITTLQHRNGYIRQCEITDCRQAMLGIWKGNIHPQEMKSMKSAYKLTENGQTRVIEHRDATGNTDILFRPWFPEQDLGRVLSERIGIVQMPVSTASAAVDAQYFLFPNWEQIRSGKEKLPSTMRDLKAHFEERQVAAKDSSEMQIAQVALSSCEQFEAEGHRAIQRDNEMYDQAKVKGWAWNYGMDAQLYMEQLGIVRRDNLADQQASKIDRLADVLADAFGNRQIAERVLDRVEDSGATKESLAAAVQPEVASSPVVSAFIPVISPASIGKTGVADDRAGVIVAVTKKTCTLEDLDGQRFTVPLNKVVVMETDD